MYRLAICLLAISPGLLPAQDKTTLSSDPPHKMLHAFLLRETGKHFDARRDVVAKLKTPDEIKARQAELKKKFLDAIGTLPEKTPLNPKVVGTIKADGYRIEKVIFESRPEHHVTGNLYIPDGAGPFPGVLIPCGHSVNGKAADAYQRASILMAKNGMVALCYDPIGQGERLQLLEKSGKAGIPGSTSEHTMVGVGALLVGRCTAHYRIWDGIRALDYLASRPEVDAKRLGCAGNSGGGTMTAYLMALDDRIACASPSCYITTLERLFETIGPQDGEQNIPGQVAFGMEQTDYLTMRAPRPTLMAVATQDFFDIKGAWTSYHEASALYKKMGAVEKMAIFEYDDKHGWSKPRREASMRWLRKWLVGKDDNPTEGDFTHFKDPDLQCTRSGQVLEDFRGVSVFDLNAVRDKDLAKERGKFASLDRKEQMKAVRHDLRLGTVNPANWGDDKERTLVYTRKIIETEKGIVLDVLMAVGGRKADAPVLLVLDDDGWENRLKADTGRFEELGKSAAGMIFLDPRGIGATAPGKLKKDGRSYFGVDFKEAFLAMHIDRPLLGQRVHDVLALIASLPTKAPFAILARGNTGLIALHAAALSDRVSEVTLEDCLISWSNVVQTPISYNQLTNVLPGVLQHYDLPELATMIAPRPLTIRNAVDAQGRPVNQKNLEDAYRVTRDRYEALKAGKSLTLRGSSGG